VQVAVVDVEPGQQGRQHASMFNSSEADEAGVFTGPVINGTGPAMGVSAQKTPVAGRARSDRALMPIIFFYAYQYGRLLAGYPPSWLRPLGTAVPRDFGSTVRTNRMNDVAGGMAELAPAKTKTGA
jgi:hypothetical protein